MSKTQARPSAPWPPPELTLPDTVEAIEAGRHGPQRQAELFGPEPLDQSRAARLRRLGGDGMTRTPPPSKVLQAKNVR
jgi:hypothetical protein